MSFFRKSLQGLGVMALVAGFVAACSSDEDKGDSPDSGETGGKGGSGTGGKGGATGGTGDTDSGTGGKSTGGTKPTTDGGPDSSIPEGDSGAGEGGDAGGPAVVRFCTDLTVSIGGGPDQDVTFRVTVGSGASAVTFTAKSGSCDPVDGKACLPIPTGADIPITITELNEDGGAGTTHVSGTTDINPGENLIFKMVINDASVPDVEIDVIDTSKATCDDFTYDDVYPPLPNASTSAHTSGWHAKR